METTQEPTTKAPPPTQEPTTSAAESEPATSSPPTPPTTTTTIDPKLPKKPNLVKRVVTYILSFLLRIGLHSTTQILLFLIGILWVCFHQYICASTSELKMRGTYFSESSLLSENAEIMFNFDNVQEVMNLSQQYQQIGQAAAAAAAADASSSTTTFGEKMDWLDSAMRNASPGRIRTYRHVFHHADVSVDTTDTTTPSTKRSRSSQRRENVYGILEPRVGANRQEAIVLVAKHRASSPASAPAPAPATSARGPDGVGVLLSLLRHLSEQRWLSKRVVVVMVDGGTNPHGWDGGLDLGTKKFVDDYTSGRLERTAGAIRGAVLLDVAPGMCVCQVFCLYLCTFVLIFF